MTWRSDSLKATRWFRALMLGPYPSAVDNSIDEPHWRWMREHGTHHVPDVRAQNDFFLSSGPKFSRRLVHLLGCSTLSAGGVYWGPVRTPHRGAPLHSNGDQAARNLRRPGGDRHREHATVPGTQGVAGAANGDERDSRRHRQFADGHSTGAGCYR